MASLEWSFLSESNLAQKGKLVLCECRCTSFPKLLLDRLQETSHRNHSAFGWRIDSKLSQIFASLLSLNEFGSTKAKDAINHEHKVSFCICVTDLPLLQTTNVDRARHVFVCHRKSLQV
eukprot:scaffold2209_cov168-Amphora_coffeaeformis.AAC.9